MSVYPIHMDRLISAGIIHPVLKGSGGPPIETRIVERVERPVNASILRALFKERYKGSNGMTYCLADGLLNTVRCERTISRCYRTISF